MDNKIDCTASIDDAFRVAVLTFEEHAQKEAAAELRTAADTVAGRLADLPRVEVVRHDLSKDADRFVLLLEDMTRLVPQAMVIIAGAESIVDARIAAVGYNNTFHNSPSIVFSAQRGIAPMELVGAQWSFDLGVMTGDVDALCHLINAISGRETEDSPIALDRMDNVLWRKDGQVLLGPAVVGTL